jgi:hypothetical protein
MDCDCDKTPEPISLEITCEIAYNPCELLLAWQAKADALGDACCEKLAEIMERWKR